MKKIINRIILVLALCVIAISLHSCNAQFRTSAGVDVNWGPNGPRVHPHLGIDVYNGGRHY